MLIQEILDKKIDYEVVKATSDTFHTRAKIGDRIINFGAVQGEINWAGSESGWDISFREKLPNGNNTFKKTGSGNELDVFSMVKDSILEFVARYRPYAMYFTADKDDSEEGNVRSDVYDRLIKRFKIPGYKYTREKQDNHDRFKLTKE